MVWNTGTDPPRLEAGSETCVQQGKSAHELRAFDHSNEHLGRGKMLESRLDLNKRGCALEKEVRKPRGNFPLIPISHVLA